MKSKIVIFLIVAFVNDVALVTNRTFPANVKFGVATAALQIEGGWDADGKGESTWDHICHTNPSYVVNNDNADIACDSYHKYKEDVSMLKNLGVDYYRFSISWPRILPKGIAGSPINQPGVDYYRNLMKELLDNGIEPMVTLFHGDLPQVLADMGGWPNPLLADHYCYFARVAFEQFGDLAKNWATFNEPKEICLNGVGSGIQDYKCAHTILKAHARVYRMYDEEFRETQGGVVGMIGNTDWFEPATDTPEDVEASERMLQFTYGWYVNPLVYGNYPQIMIDRIGNISAQQGFAQSRLPVFTEEEQDYIKGTYDFLAINTYTTQYAAASEDLPPGAVDYWKDVNVKTFVDEDWSQAASSWLRVVPWDIKKLLKWMSDTYGNPEIFVSENGYSDVGGLEDQERIDYLRDYMSNVLEAILHDGVNVTRYTCWSLMDNFEWNSGYSVKFGLYSVDFNDPDRPRTPKASAAYFKQVLSTKCLIDSCE